MVRVLLLVALLLPAACANTFHVAGDIQLEGRFISADATSVRIQPSDPIQHARAVDTGLTPYERRFGPTQIPRSDLEQADNDNLVAAYVLGSIATLSFGLTLGAAARFDSLQNQNSFYDERDTALVLTFSTLAPTIVGSLIAPPFILEAIDHHLEGSHDLRLGAAIGGTTLAVLSPLLIGFFAATEGEGFFTYITGIMPAGLAVGISILAWGWSRYRESAHDRALRDLFVTPTVLLDRSEKRLPGIALGFSW